MWRLRVRFVEWCDWIDLPLLTSMHLGWSAFSFNSASEESTLVMKSECDGKG